MQPKPALLLVASGAVLAALAVTPVMASASPVSAGPDCRAGTGLKVNRWIGQQSLGQQGLWNNDKNWSLGHYPRSTSEVACIRTAASVVMWQGSRLRVHVAAVDLDGGGSLIVQPSNSLFVEADPHQAVSTVAPGSSVDIQGAVLGGRGRIEVRGDLILSPAHQLVRLTTRSCAGRCPTRPPGLHGTISVRAGGRFEVADVPVTVNDSYHVVVIGGEMLVQGGHGRVTADPGTRLALRSAPGSDPALTFTYNGGWYDGSNGSSANPTRVKIHGGVVVKRGGGTSSVQGDVSARGGLNASVVSGTLAVASDDKVLTHLSGGSTYSTGGCLPGADSNGCQPVATPDDLQIASVTLPPGVDADGLTVTEGGQSTNFLGASTVFEGSLSDAVDTDPVLLELRYDASVIGARTPATTTVEAAQKARYRTLPPCSGGIPKDPGACVDRDLSHFASDGDLVMVVRTLHFSRYICR